MVVLKSKDGHKWVKLTSRRLTHVPRKGETLCIANRDYNIEHVSWDLEMEGDAEVVIEMREIK